MGSLAQLSELAIIAPIMNIRRLCSADAANFRALRLRALREHPEAFTSSFEDAVLRPVTDAERRLAPESQEYFWGAFADDVLVGMVGLEYHEPIKTRHKGRVVAMYVAPEYSKQGVGRLLLDQVVAQAREDRLESLVLTVTVGNGEAERLYLRAGFTCIGTEPQAIKVGQQYFGKDLMRLSLLP